MHGTGVARPALIGTALAFVLTVAAAVASPAASRLGGATTPAPLAGLLDAVAAPVALGADDLGVSTKARYVVAPDDNVIRVAVDVTVVNQTPNRVTGGVVTRYFYDGVNLGVQLEASRLRATQDGSPVRVTSTTRKNFRFVTVQFRDDIYLGETARVRLTFDLPAGTPRSASDVRVGPAFATFLAWAFGDRGSVRIEVPRAFDVDVSGEDMTSQTTDTARVFTASTDDALGWYAWVNARNDDGLTRERLELADGEEVVVRGWPEDTKWRRRVSAILSDAVPDLVGRIGLPWPVDGPLNVLEVHTPLLEGYAGFYDPKSDEITISENLDDLTIIHEASHAWFNNSLFADRWINEGLAEEYASRVLAAETRGHVDPAPVKRTARLAFPLAEWPPPAPIRDPQSDDRERYGYDASWTVIRAIVEQAGEDGMREVFRAADDGTTAYAVDDTPERSAMPNDWRRFLDLAQELGGAANAGDMFATWVLPAGEAAQLAARDQARTAYRELVAADGDWLAPAAVRLALDDWSFDRADARIAEAQAILDQRDATVALAAANDLTPPDDLEGAYEAADSEADLAAASALATNTQASLQMVVAAEAAADAPRDWLTDLGLSGKDPDGDLAVARTAWEAGDLETAANRAGLVTGTLAVAAEAGRGRAIVIGGGATVVVLLLAILLVVAMLRVRGRSRRTSATVAGAAVITTSVFPVEAPVAEAMPAEANAYEAGGPPAAPPPPAGDPGDRSG